MRACREPVLMKQACFRVRATAFFKQRFFLLVNSCDLHLRVTEVGGLLLSERFLSLSQKSEQSTGANTQTESMDEDAWTGAKQPTSLGGLRIRCGETQADAAFAVTTRKIEAQTEDDTHDSGACGGPNRQG